MRKINKIILHCSDTPAKMDIGTKEIDKWHRQRGFSLIGYHYVIRRNGVIEKGRSEDRIGAHCYGYNRTSLGVCLVGRGKYTKVQFEALKTLLKELEGRYTDAIIKGHYEYSTKTCPMFNVEEYLKENYYESI
jgi:N-acetylmuramoyl-L-alanine amidase